PIYKSHKFTNSMYNNMNNNNFSQNNLNNEDGFDNYSDNLPRTNVIQTSHTPPYNDVNTFYSYNNDFSTTDGVGVLPAHTPVSSNNVISDSNYQQYMPNDASTPHFHPQYQTPPQSNIPSLIPSL